MLNINEMIKRYSLENRYQDSGWENLNEFYHDYELETALSAAESYSKKSIVFGAVRVIDLIDKKVIKEFYGK